MGSFNVSCSISNLSISPGTKCVFIPLIRNKYHYPELERLGSMFVGDGGGPPAYFFYPFSFPIFGSYDDYGRLGHIERNKTVEVLEKFFGITIEQFIDILTSPREPEDTYSGIYEVFGINRKVIDKHYYNFSSKYLLDLGFTKTEAPITEKGGVIVNKTVYRFGNQEACVRVFVKELSTSAGKKKYPHYKIYTKGKFRIMGSGFGDVRDFLRDYKKVTGYYLCYPANKQEKVKLLNKLSGMFVHGEVYQTLSAVDMGEYGKPEVWETAAEIDIHTLESLGFSYFGDDKKIERHNKIYKHPAVDTHFVATDGMWSHIYSIKNKKKLDEHCFHPNTFIKSWQKFSGHQLEIPSELKGTSIYFSRFDVYRKSLVELDALINAVQEKNKEATSDDEKLSCAYELWQYKDLLMDSKLCFSFVHRYDPNGLLKIYEETIKDGSIKGEFVNFATFFSNLYILNKFLFPGPYAGQIGINTAQKLLAKKVEEIVIKEEQKRAEWDSDFEDDE